MTTGMIYAVGTVLFITTVVGIVTFYIAVFLEKEDV